jgi:hypothetical protein
LLREGQNELLSWGTGLTCEDNHIKSYWFSTQSCKENDVIHLITQETSKMDESRNSPVAGTFTSFWGETQATSIANFSDQGKKDITINSGSTLHSMNKQCSMLQLHTTCQTEHVYWPLGWAWFGLTGYPDSLLRLKATLTYISFFSVWIGVSLQTIA